VLSKDRAFRASLYKVFVFRHVAGAISALRPDGLDASGETLGEADLEEGSGPLCTAR